MGRGGFKCGHPRALHCVNPGSGHPDVDEFVSSLDLEENSVTSLVHQSILCSEYASLGESIKTNQNKWMKRIMHYVVFCHLARK